MNFTADDIIAVGKKSLEKVITVLDNSRFTVDPLTTSNKTICMSIPIRCFPDESNIVLILPTFLNINILEGIISLCFDKASSIFYNYNGMSCPAILSNNIFNDNKFDNKLFDCYIEEIPITKENIKNIKEFENVKIVNNCVTVGTKPKSNTTVTIPMYIENQLTFPSGGRDSKLFYIINDTYAIGTKSKWILSNMMDNFRGSLHIYFTVVTARNLDSEDYMRKNYLYVQIKRKFNSSIGDLISCTGKLFLLTARDLKKLEEVS